jgi:NAD(P)-dependent dehydrogenase (short-subunit alcohol dehydrogenase family)
MASASSFLSEIMSVGYATTKYAAFGFGEWLAFSYRGRGLKVPIACLGPVWGPMIKDIPYMHEGARTPDEAADHVLEGLTAGKFLITTHTMTLSQKAANIDVYVDFLVAFREYALSLKANGRG